MKRLFLLICTIFLFWGCGTGMKSRWGNFTAYYNTYYNAKKSYNSGLDKVLDADQNYNPQQPIRIHEVPINAGQQDFDKAIEKGAEILRKHGDTKWVDNSLLLIGKSYYFKKEYFSADQKFEELALRTEDQNLIHESIIWRARTTLELELFGQGIQYINQELNNEEVEWNEGDKAELETILAQFYVAQENWVFAIDVLNNSLENLKTKRYKERGYFLLGQLNEIQDNYREAFLAYSKVEQFYTDYDLQYLSLRKTAETARLLGDNETALATFNKMLRDDKNTEFVSELNYEIAKTYQSQGEYDKAESVYKRILRDERARPDAETKALTYNGLAEVYRFGYDNFEMAAAYYDTASRQNADLNKLPVEYNASELAISFGEYSELKNEIDYKDSLLWVSNLSTERLDSLVSEIKKRKLEELEKARKNQEQQQNTLVNVTADQEQQTNTGRNGFLNVNSPEMQENARNQFRAVWGNRPLVDNWRVEQLIETAVTSDITENEDGVVDGEFNNTRTYDASVDLSEVPFQPEEQKEMKLEIATLKYELGNLFYISLNMPDSASGYFKDVIQNHPESDKAAVSYYSLSEIQNLSGNEKEALENARSLIQKYPQSRYATRLAEKYKIEQQEIPDSLNQSIIARHQNIKKDTSLTGIQKAEKMTELALANTRTLEAAPILLDAIQKYIELGKRDTIYQQNYDDWITLKRDFDSTEAEFKSLQDSLRTQITDTSLTDIKRQEMQSVLDSTLTEPDYASVFPYYGEDWENARININLFLTNFRNSDLIQRVRILKNELEKPKVEEPESNQNPEAESEQPELEGDQVIACSEMESELEIRGGLQGFMDFMDDFDTDKESIVFTLSINQRGIVEESGLVSQDIEQNIVENYRAAIQENLIFNPVLENGQAVPVTCNFTFPIK